MKGGGGWREFGHTSRARKHPQNSRKGGGGGGGEGGGGLGTHWKPLNTSKTLARAARVVGSVGGWCGGGENGARAAKAEEPWGQ